MYIDSSTFRVKVPPERAKSLTTYLGQQIVFGIRPEDIHDPQYTPPGITAAPVNTRVDVTELMGNEVFLYLLTGTKQFIARVDPRTAAKIGHDVTVSFNMDNIHVFDRQTERAVR
jgi:multiple sugar transport system ATP-binding protein